MDRRVDRRQLGSWAERVVTAALIARGFRILARNVWLQRGELDVVAERYGVLWFVEVKCRSRRDVGPPHRAVDARKRSALYAAAREFLVRRGHRGDWGFVIASVLPSGQGQPPEVSLMRTAIQPSA